MPLSAPVIAGLLSECSSQVHVKNQISGSSVTILAGGLPVGKAEATSADQFFDLDIGVRLQAGEQVTATQSFGPETSLASKPVTVQKKPPIIGPPAFASHLYECGGCVSIQGAVPGATVEVRNAVGVVRGVAGAPDGIARVDLSGPIQAGEVLEARQQACGTFGLATEAPPPDPISNLVLAPPSIAGPLFECDRFVSVTGALDGAQVHLKRSGGPEEAACFHGAPFSYKQFSVAPLTSFEKVLASQTMPDCKAPSRDSIEVTVQPADPVPIPIVLPPLCAGGTAVHVANLRPGAQVQIFQDGVGLGLAECTDVSVAFEVPPLPAKTVITARQRPCATWSEDSNKVEVKPSPAHLPIPVIVGPLIECGSKVRVVNIHPGAMCYVHSAFLGAPIGWTQTPVKGSSAEISLAPALIRDDIIHAEVIGCGLSVDSKDVPVDQAAKPVTLLVREPVSACAPFVIVTGAIPGATVEVHVEGSWWSEPTVATTSAVEVALGGPLQVGEQVRARQSLCPFATTDLGTPATVQSGVAFVTTQHNDGNRSGANICETRLNTRTVGQSTFGLLFKRVVDGHIYAQPLFVPGVNIPGKGVHNVVYVVTMHNSVYAFDAEDPNQPDPLWGPVSLGPSFQIPRDPTDPSKYLNFDKEIGIISTPVIDVASDTIWVLAFVDAAGTEQHWLCALDITSGVPRTDPRLIQAAVAGTGFGSVAGVVTFNSRDQAQRPGLALASGMVYVCFGSYGDSPDPFHGWILGYDRVTLEQMGALCTAPNGYAAGVWMAGQAPVVDAEGNIYVMTGNSGLFWGNNGPPHPSLGILGESFVKISASCDLFDWFTPQDYDRLNGGDWDLGSSGPVMVPGTALIFGGGKGADNLGKIYVLDTSGASTMGNFHPTADVPPALQAFVAVDTTRPGSHHIHGSPVFWWGPQGGKMYLWPENDVLRAFSWQGPTFNTQPVSLGTNRDSAGMPGGILSLSTHGNESGSGIVWATHAIGGDAAQSTVTGVVRALDADDLTNELWNSEMDPARDSVGNFAKFCPPTVASGRVYLATFSGQLHVYGLLG